MSFKWTKPNTEQEIQELWERKGFVFIEERVKSLGKGRMEWTIVAKVKGGGG